MSQQDFMFQVLDQEQDSKNDLEDIIFKLKRQAYMKSKFIYMKHIIEITVTTRK